jgi:type I restriction enzyme, S subunit
MADLTSKYKEHKLRDVSMQACVNMIDKCIINFPENYIKGAFTDFFDIQGGTQPPKSKFIYEFQKGYIRFLQIRDFSSDTTPTYIPIDSKNKLCTEEDILLGRYGASVGKILTGRSGAYNVACAKLILLNREIIDPEYVFYLLHSSFIQTTIRNISRSAQGGFNKNDLAKIKVVIPRIEWQIKLLSFLKNVDDFLTTSSKLNFDNEQDPFLKFLLNSFSKQLRVIKDIENINNEIGHQQTYLRRIAEVILQEAVQGKLTKQNEADEPASKLLQRIMDDKNKLIAASKLKKGKELQPVRQEEIPFELPNGWIWCRFGNIANIRSNLVDPKSYKEYIQIAPDVIEKNTGKLIKIRTVKEADVKSWNHYFTPNHIIYSKIRPNLSKAVIVNFEGLCSADMYPIESLIVKEYLLHFILSNAFLSQVVKLDNRVKMPKINQDELNMVMVPVPPSAEQYRIVDKVKQLMEGLGKVEEQIRIDQTHAGQLLQSILKESFLDKTTELQNLQPIKQLNNKRQLTH